MNEARASVTRESVKHGALLLAATAVEQRIKLGVLPQKNSLECDDGIFEFATSQVQAAVLRLQLQQLLAKQVIFRLKRFNDYVFVLQGCLELAVHALLAVCK
jgi:hypothetical protein